ANVLKSPRGIRGFQLDVGNFTEWRVQGKVGGYKNFPDKTRGVLNEGGLYGERQGWHLPNYPLSPSTSWASRPLSSGLPSSQPGIGFFINQFELDIPENVDAMLSFVFTEPLGQAYRARLFVNGWMMGKRIGGLGPQSKFPVHEGILNYHGKNTVAIALWSMASANETISPNLELVLDAAFEGGVGGVGVDNPGWSAVGLAGKLISKNSDWNQQQKASHKRQDNEIHLRAGSAHIGHSHWTIVAEYWNIKDQDPTTGSGSVLRVPAVPASLTTTTHNAIVQILAFVGDLRWGSDSRWDEMEEVEGESGLTESPDSERPSSLFLPPPSAASPPPPSPSVLSSNRKTQCLDELHPEDKQDKMSSSSASTDAVLTQILAQLEAMQIAQQTMQAKLDALAQERTPLSPIEPRMVTSVPSTPTRGDKDTSSASTPASPSAVSYAAAARAPAAADESKLDEAADSASDVAVRAALIGAPPPPPKALVGAVAGKEDAKAQAQAQMSDKEREKILYPGRVLLS
ncbi:hypothetical protein CVT26_011759, partial [Gymnopilus dilepis]